MHSRSPDPVVLLWDIDGTLLSVGGAGEAALISAMDSALGIKADLREIDYTGRTDRRIAELIHEHFGLELDPATMTSFLQHYLRHLESTMQQATLRVLPGILAILDWAGNTPWIHLGLLTGNLKEGARIKLSHFGLWDTFPFGAFSDHSPERNELASHALAEAQRHVSATLCPSNIYVIGDTHHDITCGKSIGARTVAVATGKCSPQMLEQHYPDVLYPSFSEPEAFISLLRASHQ